MNDHSVTYIVWVKNLLFTNMATICAFCILTAHCIFNIYFDNSPVALISQHRLQFDRLYLNHRSSAKKKYFDFFVNHSDHL